MMKREIAFGAALAQFIKRQDDATILRLVAAALGGPDLTALARWAPTAFEKVTAPSPKAKPVKAKRGVGRPAGSTATSRAAKAASAAEAKRVSQTRARITPA